MKSGKHEAEAICEAVSRLVKSRTALVNETRGLLGEFGLTEVKLGVSALGGWTGERHRGGGPEVDQGRCTESLDTGISRAAEQEHRDRGVSEQACAN